MFPPGHQLINVPACRLLTSIDVGWPISIALSPAQLYYNVAAEVGEGLVVQMKPQTPIESMESPLLDIQSNGSHLGPIPQDPSSGSRRRPYRRPGMPSLLRLPSAPDHRHVPGKDLERSGAAV